MGRGEDDNAAGASGAAGVGGRYLEVSFCLKQRVAVAAVCLLETRKGEDGGSEVESERQRKKQFSLCSAPFGYGQREAQESKTRARG